MRRAAAETTGVVKLALAAVAAVDADVHAQAVSAIVPVGAIGTGLSREPRLPDIKVGRAVLARAVARAMAQGS